VESFKSKWRGEQNNLNAEEEKTQQIRHPFRGLQQCYQILERFLGNAGQGGVNIEKYSKVKSQKSKSQKATMSFVFIKMY
jgi:hypothetical protein